MMANCKEADQKYFWEESGKKGYNKVQFLNKAVGDWILKRQWQAVIDMGKILGLNNNSRIMELGCGDGSFSESVLSVYYKRVDAFDYSESAIHRAEINSKSGKVTFHPRDIRNLIYKNGDRWDCAFLMGFLHHAKPSAYMIISRLSKVCPIIIISEPNGDNFIRRLFELLPFYRKSGEDSFRLKGLVDVFNSNGYQLKFIKRIIFTPAFIPAALLAFFRSLEGIVESNSFLDRLCAINIMAFERIS